MLFAILPSHTPRFKGLLYTTEATSGRQLPKVSAHIIDFAAFPASTQYPREDGAIVFKSPSGTLHVIDDDNAAVAQLTTTLRQANLFGTDRVPFPAGAHTLIANVWRDVKALFVSGQLPRTVDDRGEAYYEKLFETPYRRGTQTAEQLLTDALGYNFEETNPCFETRNKRHVQIVTSPVISAADNP